ncbi:TOMM precursor leader peptide-binding protein [Loktanella sp. SALINAS62]|uniref:TOMM precursor leader peptide-binding protein n=1 Tax=Loktanella sp. SALINAS62 TaxID=2706124 RepID=UPI001B8B27C7|nr:TOMM precursor leader peptide-binding protein [Loktanella sp. SALINAS62]MBS1302061.1 TOMM precursor leader peptide-binding protein [Loktanella sp. SALINAS62]
MMSRPILREDFAAYSLYGEGNVLLSDTESFALEGRAIGPVLQLLDGTRTSDQIVATLAGQLSADDVTYTLEYLAKAGHLREADIEANTDDAVFWSSVGLDTRVARDQAQSLPVEVHATGGADGAAADGWLRSMGLIVAAPGQPGRVALVVARDYLDPELDALNKHFQTRGMAWLLVRPTGLTPLLGPLFVPGVTGCWACLQTRLKENREVEMMLSRRLGIDGPPARPTPRPAAFVAQALSMAAVQMARLVQTGANADLTGCIHQLDPMAMRRNLHRLTRRPQCACCGNPETGLIGGAPTAFRHRDAIAGSENGERAESAAATFARYSRHISPITGLVRELIASQWNGKTPLRSYSAGNNLAVSPTGLAGIKQHLRSFSSGKGRSDIQARTSALCEALERYSGKYRGEEIVIRATLRQLGSAGMHPNKVMLYSEAQFCDRLEWNARGSQFQIVPFWLEDDEMTDWTPVWSVTRREMRYLPSSMLFYSYPVPGERFTSWADSNGSAAGSSFEDAVLQGLFELVERDSVALWWYNRLSRQAVDLDRLQDPFIPEMARYFAGIGREFWVLDLTSDIGIPSFVAINRRVEAPTEDIVMGFGAHLDARIGIMRALTEMNQFMPAVLDVGPDGVTRYAFDDPESLRWWQTATIENQPYLRPAPGGLSDPLAYDTIKGGNIADIVETAIARVERVVPEVMILDQTRADVGLSVVKVIAPGLRHFWARYAPGRLYDAPVTMGALEKPIREDALNPIAMFL